MCYYNLKTIKRNITMEHILTYNKYKLHVGII